jgi:4-amino-4-deoxy-L-arabinose transferase-like glycosyltransferase
MEAASISRPAVQSIPARRELSTYFTIAVLAHMIAWTILPLLFQSNVALDMVEGLAWGKEWQLGYEKDPPLFPWVIHTLTCWSHKQLWISYLAGQICVAITFFSVWQLGKRIASKKEALIGALLLEGVYYFNIPTLEFNDILLQTPFAALFGWLLHKAIKEDRLRDWLLSGVVASLGLWSRYSMGAYILPLAIFALAHPVSRQRLRSRGPWLMLLTATLLFLPHLYWIVASDFISIKYVGNRAPEAPLLSNYFQDLFGFISAQLLALLPMLVIAAWMWRWRTARQWLQWHWQNFDHAYLASLALGPVVISLTLSVLTARPLRAMWGAPLWCFIGLFIVMLLQPVLTAQRWRYLRRSWLVLFLLPVVYFVAARTYGTSMTGNEQVVHFPGESLGRSVNEQWLNSTHRPLKYISGDTWSAGNVAFYANDRPSVIFSHRDLSISPWIDSADVQRAGVALVWDIKEEGNAIPPKMLNRFPNAVQQPSFSATGKLTHQFGLAFVFPAGMSDMQRIDDRPTRP